MASVAIKNKEIQGRTKKGKRQKGNGRSEAIYIFLHPNHNNHFFHDSVSLFLTLASSRAKC